MEEPSQPQSRTNDSSGSTSDDGGECGGRDDGDPDAKKETYPPKLDLRNGEKSGSFDSSTSESLLEELLDDIRRSRPASVASTPTTFVSSDCETDCVRDSGRSEAELRAMGEEQLETVLENLEHEADTVNRLLMRFLHVRDKRAGRLVNQYTKLTLILRHFAQMNGMAGWESVQFTLHRPESPDEHSRWLAAWTVLSQLPKGIPKHWRKTLWSTLAEYGTRTVEWESRLNDLFSTFSTSEDEKLGTQIVKDLHRTGNTGFTSDTEHSILKRVLLAYARFNTTTGYCQGFNILAAFILKVVEFDEAMALKVLVYLVDHQLPENYFSHSLYALSGDMAVFRHLLRFYLPELTLHMESLQREASGTIRKSYSSENPPDQQSIHGYEPPLADVFSMQWFLTIFAATLPRKACRRVWDAIFLQGSAFVLYTAVAILAVMERDLLLATTAADFYLAMSRLTEQLKKARILSSAEFMQVVYAIQRCTLTDTDKPAPIIAELREQYTYNIYPCGLQPSSEVGGRARKTTRPMAPLPSRGGSFAAESSSDESRKRTATKKTTSGRRNGVQTTTNKKETREKNGHHVNGDLPSPVLRKTLCIGGREEEDEDEDYEAAAMSSGPLRQQIHHLGKHYVSKAQQPTTVRCAVELSPPIARAFCPQQQRDPKPIPYYTAYAADVPLNVMRQSRAMSGFDQLMKLHHHRKETFLLSFTEPYHQPPLRTGMGGGGGGGGRGGWSQRPQGYEILEFTQP